MNGFLRFVGLLNAAIWFGAAVFFTFGAGPAMFSSATRALLGPQNFPYYSGAMAQIIISRFFWWQIVAGFIAIVVLVCENLYCGRPLKNFWFALVIVLFSLTLVGGFSLQPALKSLHREKYSMQLSAEKREAAAKSFRAWHGTAQLINLLMLAGIAVHLWRVANPSEATRFVNTSKFRS